MLKKWATGDTKINYISKHGIHRSIIDFSGFSVRRVNRFLHVPLQLTTKEKYQLFKECPHLSTRRFFKRNLANNAYAKMHNHKLVSCVLKACSCIYAGEFIGNVTLSRFQCWKSKRISVNSRFANQLLPLIKQALLARKYLWWKTLVKRTPCSKQKVLQQKVLQHDMMYSIFTFMVYCIFNLFATSKRFARARTIHLSRVPRRINPTQTMVYNLNKQSTREPCAYLMGYALECYTVYPKKYVHGYCFAVLCCGYTLTDFPISTRLTSLALWQSNDCPSASKATLMNMDKYFMWIHYERLHNHNKAKHNTTVCIFIGIYCTWHSTVQQAVCIIDWLRK